MDVTWIISVLSLIASFVAIAMTYHVYWLNHKHTQIDSYLKQIICLYYSIEDDSKLLKDDRLNEDALAQCYRRIEINATLMRYYVNKFPLQYDGKINFVQLINSISHSPENYGDYDKLSDEFKKFCSHIEITKEYGSFKDLVIDVI